MSQYPTNLFSTSSAAIVPLELTVSGPGWDGGERHVFEQPFALVGRDERSCLRLDDDAVSRRHAYLQQLGERVFCVDLASRTGTRWAGEARPAGWLCPSQGIQIGPFSLEIARAAWTGGTPREPGTQAGNPLQDRINGQPQLPRFNIAVDNEVRSRFRMNREMVLVGSSPDCRVRLRDAGISRYHCSLVRMPDGVWVIDLLSTTGTRLNGEPIRWARVNEGDLLRVGSYLLRLGYEDEHAPTRSMVLPEQRTEAPAAGEDDTSKSERLPELGPLRERLREQTHTLDKQAAELADVKARLEVAETMAGKLEEVCSERDHWQTQTHDLQSQIASGLAEREEMRQRLAEVQQQLAAEREAVGAANVRLDQQTAALQQLQETHEELARAGDKTRELQAELDQAQEHRHHGEMLSNQLADSRSKHDELIVRVQELEGKAAAVARLEDRLRNTDAETEQLRQQIHLLESQLSEADARKLEEVSSERDHWQSEVQTLGNRIASSLAEGEELRQRLEAAQQQLAEEREAVRAANARLDQQTAALQQLQETHEELARARDKMRELQAELDQARQHQQDGEMLRQQLTHAQSKHDELIARVLELEGKAETVDQLRNADAVIEELRQQVRGLEIQVSEAADLKRQLESAEGDLEDVYRERDHRQAEAQSLSNRIASHLVEREELRQQLEKVQQQLAEEREVVRAANVRLDQESVALQQLQSTHEELACARDKTRELQAELDQVRGHQQDAEALRHQLTEAQSKRDELIVRFQELEGRAASVDRLQDRLRNADAETQQLRQQVRVLEIQVSEAANLKGQVESPEADARELEEVRSERDRWQVEAQALRNRIASDLVEREHFVRLTAELLAVQAERDRLLAEQQASAHEVTQALTRSSGLERALTEATAASAKAHSEERAAWESERQTLKAQIEQARTTDHQAVIRELKTRSAAEREEWKLRLEGAEAQIVWERGLLQEENEQLRRQVSAFQAERDRLAARLAPTGSIPPAEAARPQETASRPAEADPLRQLAVQDRALALFCGIELGYPMEQSGRAQGANKPAEPARPHGQPASEWPQGGQQVRLSSIEQGVEDAWVQAAAEQQGPAIQTEQEQTSNPAEAAQGEKQQGLWRKILNLVRRK